MSNESSEIEKKFIKFVNSVGKRSSILDVCMCTHTWSVGSHVLMSVFLQTYAFMHACLAKLPMI